MEQLSRVGAMLVAGKPEQKSADETMRTEQRSEKRKLHGCQRIEGIWDGSSRWTRRDGSIAELQVLMAMLKYRRVVNAGHLRIIRGKNP